METYFNPVYDCTTIQTIFIILEGAVLEAKINELFLWWSSCIYVWKKISTLEHFAAPNSSIPIELGFFFVFFVFLFEFSEKPEWLVFGCSYCFKKQMNHIHTISRAVIVENLRSKVRWCHFWWAQL